VKKCIIFVSSIFVCLLFAKADYADFSISKKLLSSDPANYDNFGKSVSIAGDYAIIGVSEDADNGNFSGSAYIFKRSGKNWVEQDKLIASDGTDIDLFGNSVSISGDYAIIGADHDDDNGNNTGSAYIFKRSGENWVQQDKLIASDGAEITYLGRSVSICGDYAITGSYHDDDNGSGSAFIFKRSGEDWVQQDKIIASDGASYDNFGNSVSISGNFAIIGASCDDDNGNNSGSAYIFKRSGKNWVELDKLIASDGTETAYFGNSVSISGGYAIIGAFLDDDTGRYSGSAYIYKRQFSNPGINLLLLE
jgi:hypothetical protein